MSLYRMIVCVTDGAEVGEGKARNCTITGVAWVRSQKYHRQSILAFVSCYIPKHRSRLFVLQVLVLMVGLCIVTVIVAVNDIRLKWLQCIYIYTVYTWYDLLAKHQLTYLRPWSCCPGGFNLDKSGFTLSGTGKRHSMFQFEWSLSGRYMSLFSLVWLV